MKTLAVKRIANSLTVGAGHKIFSRLLWCEKENAQIRECRLGVRFDVVNDALVVCQYKDFAIR